MYLSHKSTCVISCDLGYYADSQMACRKCDSSCLACQGQPTFCTSCILPNYLTWNQTCKALSLIAINEIVINQVIVVCKSPCASCINSQVFCTTCLPGYSLSSNNGVCLAIAPSGFVIVQGSLIACDSSCLNCQGSPTNCTSCKLTTPYLYNGKCLTQCGYNQFGSGTNCYDCSANCNTCAVQATQCTSCPIGSYLTTQKSCMNSLSAIVCDIGCVSCSSFSYCLICDSNYIKTDDGKCVMRCPTGTFRSNSSCVSCPLGCLSCDSSTKCTSCVQQMVLTLDSKCSLSCPFGFYSNSTNCLQCPFPMTSCIC